MLASTVVRCCGTPPTDATAASVGLVSASPDTTRNLEGYVDRARASPLCRLVRESPLIAGCPDALGRNGLVRHD